MGSSYLLTQYLIYVITVLYIHAAYTTDPALVWTQFCHQVKQLNHSNDHNYIVCSTFMRDVYTHNVTLLVDD